MYLIVGLGNPGEKYANTRHNIGFRAVFSLAKAYHIKKTNYKLKSIIATGLIAGQKVMLAQPQTYMNNSGEAVRLLADYYNIPTDRIIIIYDDLDLPTGKIRIKTKGSDGGHKGLRSVIKHLGTNEIIRIRIGIDHPPDKLEVVDYVLGYFSREEEKLIKRSIEETVAAVKIIFEEGLAVAMSKFN